LKNSGDGVWEGAAPRTEAVVVVVVVAVVVVRLLYGWNAGVCCSYYNKQ